MQLIPTVETIEPSARFAPVRVGEMTLSDEAIAAELQFHPAEDLADAWQAAARTLVIRELLQAAADRQGIDITLEEDVRTARLLEQVLDVPDAG